MDAQRPAHDDNGFYNGLGLTVKITHEPHIHLQLIKMEIMKRIQGGPGTAKIIKPAGISCLLKIMQPLFKPSIILYQRRFCHFNVQQMAGTVIDLNQSFHLHHRIRYIKIHPGQIDRYG